jgi:Thermostable hemolysin
MDCVELAKRKYFQAYKAVVDPNPDLFVAACDDEADGRIRGIAGLTSAVSRRLLSEHYLDVSAQEACAKLDGGRPPRHRVCEMGPVVSMYPGCGSFLMERIPGIATDLGFDFLLSTLTSKLYEVALDAGWDFVVLANARRAELDKVVTVGAGWVGCEIAAAGRKHEGRVELGTWGSYYSSKPRTGILRCGSVRSLIMAGKGSFDEVA